MQWNIENSLVCPVTGTGFSVAASAKNLKLIIWYSGDYFLSIGSVINITQNEVFINGVPGDLQVIHAFPYTENLWSTFSKNIECPGNQNPMLLICNRRSLCKFALCPYGARQKEAAIRLPLIRASVPVLIFYVGTCCPDSPCPHCAASYSLMRNASARI